MQFIAKNALCEHRIIEQNSLYSNHFHFIFFAPVWIPYFNIFKLNRTTISEFSSFVHYCDNLLRKMHYANIELLKKIICNQTIFTSSFSLLFGYRTSISSNSTEQPFQNFLHLYINFRNLVQNRTMEFCFEIELFS